MSIQKKVGPYIALYLRIVEIKCATQKRVRSGGLILRRKNKNY